MMLNKTYKTIKHIIIVIGILGGFILWLFLPPTIENNWLIHIGNSPYASKWGLLLLLAIPLFALNEAKIEIHSNDEVLKQKALKQAVRKAIILAIFCSGCTLTVMAVALLNTL